MELCRQSPAAVNELDPGGAPEQELCGNHSCDARTAPAACSGRIVPAGTMRLQCRLLFAPTRVRFVVACHVPTRLYVGCTRDCTVCLMARPVLPARLPARPLDMPGCVAGAAWLVWQTTGARHPLRLVVFFVLSGTLCVCPSGDTHLQALELCLPYLVVSSLLCATTSLSLFVGGGTLLLHTSVVYCRPVQPAGSWLTVPAIMLTHTLSGHMCLTHTSP